jgi:hypothetical protein
MQEIDPRSQLRHAGIQPVRVFHAPDDVDSIMTAQALSVGMAGGSQFQFDGILVCKTPANSVPAGAAADLAFPIRPTITYSATGAVSLEWRYYNQLGEYRKTIFNKATGGTTSRMDFYVSKLLSLRVLSAETPANTISLGSLVPTGGNGLVPLPLPFVPSRSTPGLDLTLDVAGVYVVSLGGATVATATAGALTTGVLQTSVSNRTVTPILGAITVGQGPTSNMEFLIIPNRDAAYLTDSHGA